MDKKDKEGGQGEERIQMSAGRKTAMAAREAPEEEQAGCLGEIGQGVTTEGGERQPGRDSKDKVAGKQKGR